MRVHLFGGASSSSCANFAVRKTVEDNKEEFDSVAIDKIDKIYEPRSLRESINILI